MNYCLRKSERIINKNKSKDSKISSKNSNKRIDNNNNDNNECIKKKRNRFVCDRCSAKSVTDKFQKNKSNTKPKLCYDSVLNKWLKVCDNCSKSMSSLEKFSQKTQKICLDEEKAEYLSKCHSFSSSLVQLFNDKSAERLFCPNFKLSGNACACLQRYVIGIGNNLEEKHKRAQHLFELLKKAKHLSNKKSYLSNNTKTEKIGLGNGQKKCKEFENFININRNYLRNELKFCEKAVQKLLYYSNNYLHKKLKTEANTYRVERQKGKSATGKLIDIKLLINENCCKDKCVRMVDTHYLLLEEWRQRSAMSQMDARHVLSEMLTPTQAFRTNCTKFISLVTGSSLKTINTVNQYLRSNGGKRGPFEHGLKKFWDKNSNKTQINNSISDSQIQSNTIVLNNTTVQNSLSPQMNDNIVDYCEDSDPNRIYVNNDRINLFFENNNRQFSVTSNISNNNSLMSI